MALIRWRRRRVVCAVAAIPAALTIGLVRCRRALNLNQPTKESNHE